VAGVGDVRPVDPFGEDELLRRRRQQELLGVSPVSPAVSVEDLLKGTKKALPPLLRPKPAPDVDELLFSKRRKTQSERFREAGLSEPIVRSTKEAELRAARESKERAKQADTIETAMASLDRMLGFKSQDDPVRRTLFSALWLRAGGPTGVTSKMVNDVMTELSRDPEGLYVSVKRQKAGRYENVTDVEAARSLYGGAVAELPFDLLEYRAAGLPGAKDRRTVRGRSGEAFSPGKADALVAEAFGVDPGKVGELSRSEMFRGLTHYAGPGTYYGEAVLAGQGPEELLEEGFAGARTPEWIVAVNAAARASNNPIVALLSDPAMQGSLARIVAREDPGIAEDNGLHLYLNALGTLVNEPSKIVRASAGDTRVFQELDPHEQVLSVVADFLPQAAVGWMTGGAAPTFGATSRLAALSTKAFVGTLGSSVTDLPDVARAMRRSGGFAEGLKVVVPEFLAQLDPRIYADPKRSLGEKVQAGLQQAMVGLGLTSGGLSLASRLTAQVDPVRFQEFQDAGGADAIEDAYRPEVDRLRTRAVSVLTELNGGKVPEWASQTASDWAEFMGWMAQSTARRTGRDAAQILQGLDVRLGEYAESVRGKEFSQRDAALEQRDVGPGFYSKLDRVVEEKVGGRVTKEQLLATLRAAGVKEEEIEWARLGELFEGRASATKQDVLDHLAERGVTVEEVVRTEDATYDPFGRETSEEPAEFKGWTLPGGENYRELAIKLPRQSVKFARSDEAIRAEIREANARGDSAAAQRLAAEYVDNRQPATFKDAHFGGENVLAHVRFDERKGPNGERVLHVAEIQSDWHQTGRKQGYKASGKGAWEVFDATTGRRVALVESEEAALDYIAEHPKLRNLDYSDQLSAEAPLAVPDAPFKKTWHELAFKRMLRWAVENGFDELTWDTGKTQNERHDLAKVVDRLFWSREGGLMVVKKGETTYTDVPGANRENLAEYVGEANAKKLLDAKPVNTRGDRMLPVEDFEMGGSGMVGFYDRMLPAFANKYLKKWGGKVESGILETAPVAKDSAELSRIQNEIKAVESGGWHRVIPDPRRKGAFLNQYFETGDGDWHTLSSHENGPLANAAMRAEREATLNELRAQLRLAEGSGATSVGVHRVRITPEMRAGVIEGQPLFQREASSVKGGASGQRDVGKAPRGRIRFEEADRAVIELMQGADFSTLMHEGMHYYRRALPEGDEKVLGKWAGAEEGRWSVEAEEKVARGFERYLLEGKAPTPGLAGIFGRAKAWMVERYGDAVGLNRAAGGSTKITKAVRDVFDELVVGDAERGSYEAMRKAAAGAVQAPEEAVPEPVAVAGEPAAPGRAGGGEAPVAAAVAREGGAVEPEAGPVVEKRVERPGGVIETTARTIEKTSEATPPLAPSPGDGEGLPANLPGAEVVVEPTKMALPGGVKVTQVAKSPEGVTWYRARIPTRTLMVRKGLQFKKKGIVDPESATTAQFAGVKAWDPVTAGVLTAWQTKDGALFVVNGHHRRKLALEVGQGELDVWIMRESDGITELEARAIGALQNIKDGKGSPIDAAAVLRDLGVTVEQLEEYGVTLRSGLGREAVALTRLPDEALELVQDGVVLEEVAAAIGEAGIPAEHVLGLVRKARDLDTRAQGAELAAIAKQMIANKAVSVIEDLFGETSEVPLAEMARLSDGAKRAVLRDKRLLAAVAKGKATGATVVDVEAQKAAARLEAVAAEAMTSAGVVKVLNEEAVNYAKDTSKQQYERSVGRIVEVARAEAERRIGGDFSGGESPSGRGAREEVPGGRVRAAEAKGVAPPPKKRPAEKIAEAVEEMVAEATGTAKRVDAAAAVVAPEPTPAQKEAGNYKMGHVAVQGLEVTIETAKGGVREAVDGSWRVEDFPAHYGYFKGTEGKDGDHVDVYVGDAPDSPKVWVVDQTDLETRRFDEHKVLLGFSTKEEALAAYDAGFADGSGPKRRGTVTETSVDQLKAWFAEGDGRKRFAAQVGALRALEKAPESPVLKASEVQPQESPGVAAKKKFESAHGPKPAGERTVDARRPMTSEDFGEMEPPPEIFAGPVPGGALDGSAAFRESLKAGEVRHEPTHVWFEGAGYDLDAFEAKAWKGLHEDYAKEYRRLKSAFDSEEDVGLRELAAIELKILQDNYRAERFRFLDERARYQLDMAMVTEGLAEFDPRRVRDYLEQRDADEGAPVRPWKVADPKAPPRVLANFTKWVESQFVALGGNPLDELRATGTAGSDARVRGQMLAEGTNKILDVSAGRIHGIEDYVERVVEKAYGVGAVSRAGNVWKLDPKVRDSLRAMAVKVRNGQLGRLTGPEAAVHRAWTQVNGAFVNEGQSLGLKVEHVVAGLFDQRWVGKEVEFFDPMTRRNVEGKIVGGGEDFIVVSDGRGDVRLEKWTRFLAPQMVAPAYFMPHRLTKGLHDRLGEFDSEEYETIRDVLIGTGQAKDEADVRAAVRVLRGAPEGDIAVTGGPARLETPRIGVKLPDRVVRKRFREALLTADSKERNRAVAHLITTKQAGSVEAAGRMLDRLKDDPFAGVGMELPKEVYLDIYENDFLELAGSHIRESVLRIERAREWGRRDERFAWLMSGVGKDARALAEQVRFALGGDRPVTEAQAHLKAALSFVTTWEYLGKLTSGTTALKQPTVLANAVGVLGGRQAVEAGLMAARSLREKGAGPLTEVRLSGAVDQTVRDLLAVETLSGMARTMADWGMTVTGVKPADVVMRYHGALTGLVAVRDAVRRLRIDAKGVVQRDRHYRLLKDWFMYSDADIVRFAADRDPAAIGALRLGERLKGGKEVRGAFGMTKQDELRAYHGGAKTNIRARNADLKKEVAESDVMRQLFMLQTFNYGQVKVLGWTVKEAFKGNPLPLLRLTASWAAMGMMTDKGVTAVRAWQTGHSPEEDEESLLAKLTSGYLSSGALGLFSGPIETARREYEPGRPFDYGRFAEKAVDWSLTPASVNTLVSAFKAMSYEQKTDVGFWGGVNEFLRQDVVLYGRLGRRGEADMSAVERRRSELRRSLEEQGFTDYDVQWLVDLNYPVPPARDEAKEFTEYMAQYYEMLKAGKSPRQAQDSLGRKPRQFRGQAAKREAALPSGTARKARGMSAAELIEAGKAGR